MSGSNIPILRLFTRLDLSLPEMTALEMFGGRGDWQVKHYAELVNSLDIWEINPDFKDDLRRNCPHAEIQITDAYEEVKRADGKYNLIVIDAPLDRENYELFPHAFRLAKPHCTVVVNVNMIPYNFDCDRGWWNRRLAFYGTERLAFSGVADIYRRLCAESGFRLISGIFENRRAKRGLVYLFGFNVAHIAEGTN